MASRERSALGTPSSMAGALAAQLLTRTAAGEVNAYLEKLQSSCAGKDDKARRTEEVATVSMAVRAAQGAGRDAQPGLGSTLYGSKHVPGPLGLRRASWVVCRVFLVVSRVF